MRDDSLVIDLVPLARRGDQQAWDVLVERYAPLVWSICRRYRMNEADAHDIGQNVWLQLLGKLDKIRDPAALPGWLTTITQRRCARALRATRGPRAAGQLLDAQSIPDDQAGVAEDQPSPCCQRLIALLIEDPPPPPEAAAAVSGLISKHMH